MFILTLNDKTIHVDFHHYPDGTACYFTEDLPDTGKRNVAFGKSVRNPKDTPCRAIGRKLALGRALIAFDKPTRKMFWDAYHQKTRGTK